MRSTITLFCYCRADAVKDERSEVNHISGNVCARSAEESKGKALNYAMQAEIFASRSNQPRREIEPPLHLPRRSRFELPQALFHSRHSAYERLLRGGQGHASALGGARWQWLKVVGALLVRGVSG